MTLGARSKGLGARARARVSFIFSAVLYKSVDPRFVQWLTPTFAVQYSFLSYLNRAFGSIWKNGLQYGFAPVTLWDSLCDLRARAKARAKARAMAWG